ncbi:hypothetical protein AJ80_00251 [Polytolypa hystricis UAMH7299]|uniref:PCA1 HMA heavy metal-associated domain-containing protein n=1 Tax=Polytolypa hystricis (strain UAMH7299) TaxID=1447883 RepID=A0A2B7Z235_POLH7|nr:hypothetical protein AJ80_00251 [Polytolypa hystricis UAMH7299]
MFRRPRETERNLSTSHRVSGCETNLKRALAIVKSVKDLKTSLVLALAKFDLDLSAGSLAEVMQHLEGTTEFKCERWPGGVTKMRDVNERIVHVAFDPKTIGARGLVEKGWGNSISLAASRRPETRSWQQACPSRRVPYLAVRSSNRPDPGHGLGSASQERGSEFSKACHETYISPYLARMIEMDLLLIVLSTSAAFIFSVASFGYLVAGQPLSAGDLFETSTPYHGWSRSGEEREIDARLLEYGDMFKGNYSSYHICDCLVLLPIEALSSSQQIASRSHRTSHDVFDKTSTLTRGKLTVAQEEYTGNDPSSAKSLLLGLVRSVKHLASAAVAAHLKAQGVSASAVSDPKLNLSFDLHVRSVLSQGHTAFFFTINDSLASVFALEDSLRPDATFTIMALHERGILVHVVSGDDDGAVRSVATQLNIPDINVRSRCTPADKQAYI